MDLGFAGKVALVTGASEGMGRATAAVLGAENARLALVARTMETLEASAEAARAAGAADVHLVVADLTEPGAPGQVVADVVDHYGEVQFMANTIGLCEVVPGGILAQDDGYWDRAYQSVLMANVRLCRAVVPVLKERGGGAIVNTSAMSSRHYLPVMSHYSAMKIALAHFTKNLGKAFAHDHIRANAVMPGMIESEGVARRKAERIAETGWSDEEFFAYVNDKYDHCTWSDRLGRPEEIANAIAFLLSDKASYINGVWLNVDGGSTF